MSSRYYIYDSYTDSVAEFGIKDTAKNLSKKAATMVNRARGSAGRSAGRAVSAATGTGNYRMPYAGSRLGAVGNRIKNVYESGKVGKAALGAAGLGAAGAVAGGGYMGKRAYDKKQKERGSLKGRIKRLLGR